MAKSLQARSQLSRLTKEVLVASIQGILTEGAGTGPALVPGDLKACMDAVVAPLLLELRELRTTLSQQMDDSKRRMDQLEEKLLKQSEHIAKQDKIIANHQREMEKHDEKERETILVVLGVPDADEQLEGDTADRQKLSRIWRVANVTAPIESCRRLGRPTGVPAGRVAAGTAGPQPRPHRRPLLVTVATREERDEVLQRARDLKQVDVPYTH